MNAEEILAQFRKADALLEGHFLLSSGLHSTRYVQCALALQHPWLAESLCAQLAEPWKGADVQCVIGPAMGAVTLAYELARALGVRGLFAEREEGRMALRRGFRLAQGERVVVCEDVLTTGKSAGEVIQDVVLPAGAEVAGVAALVDRGGAARFEEYQTHALVRLDIPTYHPEECPLCREGQPLVKPGSREGGGKG